MLHFLFPATAMVAAIILLMAGALGDLESWQARMEVAILSIAGDGSTEVAVLPPPPPPVPDIAPEHDVAVSAPQAPDLQQQVAAVSQNLETLRATAEQTRQELVTLRQQREQEREALDRARAEAAVAREHPPAAAAPANSATGPTVNAPAKAGAAKPAPAAARPVPARTTTARPASAVARPPTEAPREAVQQNLMATRAALVAGRGEEARRLMGVAQFGMQFRPPTSDQPANASYSPPAAQVARAAASLDQGDYNGAIKSIDVALTMANRGANSQ